MTDASHSTGGDRSRADVVGGLLAGMALFLGLIALAYHPIPFAVTAMLLGLVAALMAPRHATLAGIALAAAAIGFVGGMTIAVLTENPLW